MIYDKKLSVSFVCRFSCAASWLKVLIHSFQSVGEVLPSPLFFVTHRSTFHHSELIFETDGIKIKHARPKHPSNLKFLDQSHLPVFIVSNGSFGLCGF
jgi:hypothetical protein